MKQTRFIDEKRLSGLDLVRSEWQKDQARSDMEIFDANLMHNRFLERGELGSLYLAVSKMLGVAKEKMSIGEVS